MLGGPIGAVYGGNVAVTTIRVFDDEYEAIEGKRDGERVYRIEWAGKVYFIPAHNGKDARAAASYHVGVRCTVCRDAKPRSIADRFAELTEGERAEVMAYLKGID
jgi:hypothetical protein